MENASGQMRPALHSGVLALCPQCDAIGPHPAQGQAVARIDCGEWLGRLTPGAFIPAEAEAELISEGGLERVEAERVLQQVMQHAQAIHRRQGSRYALLLVVAALPRKEGAWGCEARGGMRAQAARTWH